MRIVADLAIRIAKRGFKKCSLAVLEEHTGMKLTQKSMNVFLWEQALDTAISLVSMSKALDLVMLE